MKHFAALRRTLGLGLGFAFGLFIADKWNESVISWVMMSIEWVVTGQLQAPQKVTKMSLGLFFFPFERSQTL